MIPISANLAARATQIKAASQPMVLAAIWPEKGAEDSLSTVSRMSGLSDRAAIYDTNVKMLKDTGELTLADGSYVALNLSGNLGGIFAKTEWNCYVTDVYHNVRVGIWPFDSLKYVHDNYTYNIVTPIPSISITFISAATISVDTLRVQLGNAGNVSTVAGLRIVDIAQSKQVGNLISVPLTAGAAFVTKVLSGFSAGLVKGRKYRLEVVETPPNTAGLGGGYMANFRYFSAISLGGFDVTADSAAWFIPLSLGMGIPLGGFEGFKQYGFAWRTLDVCAYGALPPTGNGYLTLSDFVPAQGSMRIEAWSTDNPALASIAGVVGWSMLGGVESGQIVSPARFWRFKISMSSNFTHDESPRLGDLKVTYAGEPIVLGTHAQKVGFNGLGNAYYTQTVKCINKISSTTSSLEPVAKTIMVGKMTLELAPHPVVAGLLSRPLRAQRCLIRVGYSDLSDTVPFYDGIVRDLSYSNGRYVLTIQDPIELMDVSIPRDRWQSWDSTIHYLSGVTVSYGNKSYLSLVSNNNIPPDSDPVTWQDMGSVWVDIVYLPNTHLADVATDLLQNRVNLASERIDFASFMAVKLRYPDRVIGGRIIQNPESALAMLSDIAWLLESYWVIKDGGRLSLFPEPDTAESFVDVITPHDIKESLQYRRGWAELKNECMILTQYTGTGSGNEQFGNAIVVVNADSVANYGMNAVHEFRDKWDLSMAELTKIATRFVSRWKDGRRIIRIDASMRMLAIEVGEVLLIRSAQLPSADVTVVKTMVLQKDIDWMNQSLQITLMEV